VLDDLRPAELEDESEGVLDDADDDERAVVPEVSEFCCAVEVPAPKVNIPLLSDEPEVAEAEGKSVVEGRVVFQSISNNLWQQQG
jgi:hypothetical protein